MVLKEDHDTLDQERMRFQKLLIGIRYVSRIGESSLLVKHLQLLLVGVGGYRCISKALIDDRNGHVSLGEGFMEHCGWVWYRKKGGVSTGRVT